MQISKQIHFLLADDDSDDRYFFEKAIRTLHPETRVSFAVDGEKLMSWLSSNLNDLPEVLFLDLNMPRKNGAECLKEIKLNRNYDNTAIIIYSTSAHHDIADILYNFGAHYYVRKPDLEGLIKVLQLVLRLLIEKRLGRPAREQFILKVA